MKNCLEQSLLWLLNRLHHAWEIFCTKKLEVGRDFRKQQHLTAVEIPAVAVAGDRILGWMDRSLPRFLGDTVNKSHPRTGATVSGVSQCHN